MVAYGTAGAVADRVQNGEATDLVISSVPMIDRLQTQGKVAAADRVIIAKVGVGAFVRKGAAKPDISSADAFKRAMLAARSIAYPDPAGGGASGIYVASLLERLGIAAEMKPKTKLSTLGTLYASVASGDVEIGFNQVSEILAQPTVELAAPLPAAIQNYTQFSPWHRYRQQSGRPCKSAAHVPILACGQDCSEGKRVRIKGGKVGEWDSTRIWRAQAVRKNGEMRRSSSLPTELRGHHRR